jgi:hypothetical protein
MAEYEDVAAALMKSNMSHEFVWEGDIVEMTGRYACPVSTPNMAPNVVVLNSTSTG